MPGGKPLASLSSGLLARKGQARPAMRPQGFGGFASSPAAVMEDLGWNDMGGSGRPFAPPPAPPVVAMREALREEIERTVEAEPDAPEAVGGSAARSETPRPVSDATAARIGRESARRTAKGGKAAFTLRLDAERHLRLRLASALDGRSAQLLVTQAVDAMLETMPEAAALAARLPEPKRRRQGGEPR